VVLGGVVQPPQRIGAAGGGVDPAHSLRRSQHADQVLERGRLVVHREESKAIGHAALTPARNLGIVMTTVVPDPGAESSSSPYPSPNAPRSRPCTLEADAAAQAVESRTRLRLVHAHAVV